MSDFAENDLREIERERDLPPDEPLNYYGQPITSPEYYDGEHVVNPMSAGQPPCCSCGWTPHGDFTMRDHLDDVQ